MTTMTEINPYESPEYAGSADDWPWWSMPALAVLVLLAVVALLLWPLMVLLILVVTQFGVTGEQERRESWIGLGVYLIVGPCSWWVVYHWLL